MRSNLQNIIHHRDKSCSPAVTGMWRVKSDSDRYLEPLTSERLCKGRIRPSGYVVRWLLCELDQAISFGLFLISWGNMYLHLFLFSFFFTWCKLLPQINSYVKNPSKNVLQNYSLNMASSQCERSACQLQQLWAMVKVNIYVKEHLKQRVSVSCANLQTDCRQRNR